MAWQVVVMLRPSAERIHANFQTFPLPSPSLLFCAMRYAPPSRSMASFWHAIKSLVRKPDSQLVRFNNSDFKILPSDQQIEEEAHDNITKGRYYPVRIGDVIKEKYQVLGKLGYGLGSTVWLANELR